MSVPPQIIQVKRKRNDDGPVTFLRIEENTKRHRSGAFLYQRHDPEAALGSPSGPAAAATHSHHHKHEPTGPPTIQASRPGEENLPLEKLRRAYAPGNAPSPSASSSFVTSAPPPGPNPPPAAAAAASKHALAGGSNTPPPSRADLPRPPQSAAAKVVIEPRRFHLSRAQSAADVVLGPRGGVGSRVTKLSHSGSSSTRSSSSALFVERSGKRKQARPRTSVTAAAAAAAAEARAAAPEPSPEPEPAVQDTTTTAAEPEPGQLPKGPSTPSDDDDRTARGGGAAAVTSKAPRHPKLPLRRGGGAAAARAVPAHPTPPGLPDSFMNRWDADMEQLARDMDEYTLQHILRDLEVIDARKAAEAPGPRRVVPTATPAEEAASASPPSAGVRFRPHAPAKRYAERHQGGAAAAPAIALQQQHHHHHHGQQQQGDAAMGGGGDDDDDDDDDEGSYVLETYVRVPASSIGQDVDMAAPGKVGLLVLEGAPDVDYFYGDESESEEEFEDEDDENAENYYTADYPDDEVASDDEFDRNAYHYRTGNASDMEEFDDDEGVVGDAGSEGDEDGGPPGKISITIGSQPLPRS